MEDLSSLFCPGGAEDASPRELSGMTLQIPPPLPGRTCSEPKFHGFRCAPPVATTRGPSGAEEGDSRVPKLELWRGRHQAADAVAGDTAGPTRRIRFPSTSSQLVPDPVPDRMG